MGLTLLAAFAVVALLLTFTVRNGGRADERHAPEQTRHAP